MVFHWRTHAGRQYAQAASAGPVGLVVAWRNMGSILAPVVVARVAVFGVFTVEPRIGATAFTLNEDS